MKIEEGRIIPGVGIGDFKIGMKKEELIRKIGDEYQECPLGSNNSKIILENAQIWFDEKGFAWQIGVRKGFMGTYGQCIKIGARLRDINKTFKIICVQDIVDVLYEIEGVPGMCFEPEDEDDDDDEEWDELAAPIEWILVYKINEANHGILMYRDCVLL